MKRRKKKRREPVLLRTGVAWYRPEQWERLRDIVPDPEALEETYEEWLAMATRALSRLAEQGNSGALSSRRWPYIPTPVSKVSPGA